MCRNLVGWSGVLALARPRYPAPTEGGGRRTTRLVLLSVAALPRPAPPQATVVGGITSPAAPRGPARPRSRRRRVRAGWATSPQSFLGRCPHPAGRWRCPIRFARLRRTATPTGEASAQSWPCRGRHRGLRGGRGVDARGEYFSRRRDDEDDVGSLAARSALRATPKRSVKRGAVETPAKMPSCWRSRRSGDRVGGADGEAGGEDGLRRRARG